MNIEELLKPRYKVIAAYPGMKGDGLEVGQILTCRKYDNVFSEKFWCEMNDEYPHLFKKLEWWEDREEKDMPEYVRILDTIWHIKKWEKSFPDWRLVNHVDEKSKKEGDTGSFASIEWQFDKNKSLPATEEEYNNQNK